MISWPAKVATERAQYAALYVYQEEEGTFGLLQPLPFRDCSTYRSFWWGVNSIYWKHQAYIQSVLVLTKNCCATITVAQPKAAKQGSGGWGWGVEGGTFCCVAKCCIILQQFVSSETTSTSRFWVPLTCYSACFAVFLPLIQFFYSLLLCFIVFTLFHYMKLHEFYCITFRFDVLKDNINIYFS